MTTGELVDVSPKVLGAEMVVDTIMAALQCGPVAFYPVGVGHVADVLTNAVLDRRMEAAQAIICLGLVGVNHGPAIGVPMHESLERGAIGSVDDLGLYPVGLTVLDADYGGLPSSPRP